MEKLCHIKMGEEVPATSTRKGERTNWSDENDDVDKEPIRDHGNRSTHVAHALRVDLGRITEWDG